MSGWFNYFIGRRSANEDSVTTREDRQKCWDARDEYFACLDKAQVIKAGEEGGACSKEKKRYEGTCAKSWIEYFNQRRVIAEAQKDRLARASEQAQAAKK